MKRLLFIDISQLHNGFSDRFVTDMELESLCDLMNRNIGLLLDKTVDTGNIISGKRMLTAAQGGTRFHRAGCVQLFTQSIDSTCIYGKAFCNFLDRDLMIMGLDNKMSRFVM